MIFNGFTSLTCLETFPRKTRKTRKKTLPDRQSRSGRAPGGDAGDAAGPKGEPFVRRLLPRPAVRFAAVYFACQTVVSSLTVMRTDLGWVLGTGREFYRVFRVFRGKKFQGKLTIDLPAQSQLVKSEVELSKSILVF